MLAADANILVRLLVSDDLDQQRAIATRFGTILNQGHTVLVTSVALAEVGWVLSSVYGYNRAQIVAALTAFDGTAADSTDVSDAGIYSTATIDKDMTAVVNVSFAVD